MREKIPTVSRGDIILAAVLLAAALLIYLLLPKSEASAAVVTVGEETVLTIDLTDDSSDGEYIVPNTDGVVILVQNGSARVGYSPCKTQECVACGRLDKGGDIAVCLPQRMVLRIEGAADADAVTY